LITSDDIFVRNKIASKFKIAKVPSGKGIALNDSLVKKVPPPISPCLLKEKLEKAKSHSKNASGRKKNFSPLSYAQATLSISNILKIKEAFPVLPNSKILEIYNTTFPKQNDKRKKVQPTTKGPFKKQAIVPVSSNLTESIMEDTNTHTFQINTLLKNIKSTLHAEFICPYPSGVSIITNNIPNPSDLTIIEKYFKSMEGINTNDILVLHFPQLKSYLKIMDIPYL